jgi:hypothetical protein
MRLFKELDDAIMLGLAPKMLLYTGWGSDVFGLVPKRLLSKGCDNVVVFGLIPKLL